MGKTTINIYGGTQQVITDAEKVIQHVYTEDGKTVIANEITKKK